MKVDLIDSMGSDLTVVNAARVSFDKHHSTLDESDERLIYYLARHEHWSPFAHCVAQFRVEAPVFVATQLKRHQVGFAVNEVSRRYVSAPPTFEAIIWRSKPAGSVKQGSGSTLPAEGQRDADMAYGLVVKEASVQYQRLLDIGVAPEQARAVLPQSMITSWYWTGSLYAWARACGQRSGDDAQAETREICAEIAEHMARLFPLSWRALMEGGNDPSR